MRKSSLKGHIRALQLIRTEICYKNAPLEAIVGQLDETCGAAVVGFYQNAFSTAANGLAFSTAAERYYTDLGKSGLLTEDIDPIRSACRVLGRYDSTAQAEQLAASCEQLDARLQELQRELMSKGRICKTTGATVGILLALIVA